jgi:light-regulated signal transduction histidine kinase (bacteriophytochrome)
VPDIPAAEGAWLAAQGVQSILVAPLIVSGQWYGWISMQDRETPRVWQEELNLIRVAASEVSGALENARLLEEVRGHASQLADRVAERTSELEVANRELEAFAYSVSHDLRAPLRGIDGFSQLLVEEHADELDELGKEYLGRLRAASQRMAQLIDDLLQLSRVARRELRRRPVDLSELAQSLFLELLPAESRDRVEIEIAPGLIAEADPGLLRIVMQNLLENAVKFTANRPRPCIEVGVEPDGAFSVRDNGAGFDMRYSEKLFAVFQRLHPEREYPGSGVGLATVQRIIRRHGGRVWAESRPGEGAVFYFTLSG